MSMLLCIVSSTCMLKTSPTIPPLSFPSCSFACYTYLLGVFTLPAAHLKPAGKMRGYTPFMSMLLHLGQRAPPKRSLSLSREILTDLIDRSLSPHPHATSTINYPSCVRVIDDTRPAFRGPLTTRVQPPQGVERTPPSNQDCLMLLQFDVMCFPRAHKNTKEKLSTS